MNEETLKHSPSWYGFDSFGEGSEVRLWIDRGLSSGSLVPFTGTLVCMENKEWVVVGGEHVVFLTDALRVDVLRSSNKSREVIS